MAHIEGSRILLDYDHDDWFQIFCRRAYMIESILDIKMKKEKFYKTTKGHHVEAEIDKELPPLAICAIQAVMGSDPIRETFNIRRILRGQKNWNILFDYKEPLKVRRRLIP